MKASMQNVVLLILILGSAGLASAIRPTIIMADARSPTILKSMVPNAFGEWELLLAQSTQIVDPQQKEMLDKLYSETLTRTYVNSNGYRIMLSIAYGKNQSNALQMHKPEVCYPAQGFTLMDTKRGTLDLLGRPAAATRLQTSLGQRHEPVTYWAVVGDQVTKDAVDRKVIEMQYASRREIPDGMLVRVSSIDTDTANAFAIQSRFATQMVQAIAPEYRSRFAGDPQVN